MKKMFLIGVLSCFAMPALAQQSLPDTQHMNFDEVQDLRPGGPGGPGRGGFPGGGIGNGPRRPGHPGNVGHGGNRFPGRGEWGQGHRWWRSRFGGQWYVRFRWWPGYGYTAGACFAQDNDGYLFSGRTGSRAVYNCEDNSRSGGCEFVGCD